MTYKDLDVYKRTYSRAQSDQDTQHFLKMALGSNDEVLFNLVFMKDAKLIEPKLFSLYYDEYTIAGKQLTKLLQRFVKS